jgi:hypothetical protein
MGIKIFRLFAIFATQQIISTMQIPRFMQRCITSTFLIFSALHICAQVNYTADDRMPPYTGLFSSGYNQSYYAGWVDKTQADIAAGNPALGIQGVGTKSIRQGLYYELLNVWGYNTRVAEMQHYKNLGMTNNTALILGGNNGGSEPAPPAAVRDMTQYCPGQASEMFSNMYLPIWDGGANGTPYNDQNHYAKYLYQTVVMYKDYVKFWEIWNEPGFDYTGNTGWRPAGDPVGNWWDRDPLPCEYKLRAPIEHYVRMLRISYDVIKTVDPTAYVYMSSPGYPSFLDAVCRNTDNPNGGSVTAEFPKGGGAYFDGIAYHAYPHFDGSTTIDPWTQQYMRNSDRCAQGMLWYRDNLQTVLDKYGYTGTAKPRKEFIISEINLPRKQFTNPIQHFGSDDAQRNYLLKAYALGKRERIHQLHVYLIAELRAEADATYEFDLMGLYKNISNKTAQQAEKTQSGVAWKTVSDLLHTTYHDAGATAKLNLPSGVKGEAFQRTDGKTCYMLWAECKIDKNEGASATYTFPAGLQVKNPQVYRWDWSVGVAPTTPASPMTSIALSGDPIFVVADVTSGVTEPEALEAFHVSPNPVEAGQSVQVEYVLRTAAHIEITVTDAMGKTLQKFAEGAKSTGNQFVTIPTTGFAAGMYWLSIRTSDGVATRKLVVE